MKLSASSPSKVARKHQISFSLAPHLSCIGETKACACCYANKAMRQYKQTNIAWTTNLQTLVAASNDELVPMLQTMLDNSEARKLGIFRIHASGDFFNQRYLDAWVHMIKDNPNINFWAYTRSFSLKLEALASLPNMQLFLSCDDFNRAEAFKLLQKLQHTGTKLAFGPYEHNKALPDNSFACPAITGQINHNGACLKCKLCIIKGRTQKHVVFYKH